MKIKMLVELFTFSVMVRYAEYCGWALGMAHAWADQHALIAGYLGKGGQFDIREFPQRQKPGSFNLDRIMESITSGAAKNGSD